MGETIRERLLTAQIIIAGLVVGIIFITEVLLIERADQRRLAFRSGSNIATECAVNFTKDILRGVPEGRVMVAWEFCMEEKAKVAGYEWR